MILTLAALGITAAAAIIAWVSLRWMVGALPPGEDEARRKADYRWWMRAVEVVFVIVMLVAGGAMLGWCFRAKQSTIPAPTQKVPSVSAAEEAELRRVVRESQMFEFLTLHRAPDRTNRDDLKKYWLPTQAGGREIINVEESLDRLARRGWHYGPESQAEQFAVMAVSLINFDTARVETRERWFLPIYDKSGRRVPGKNFYFGPYDVAYTLRKVDGQWLIAESTTPRAK